MKVCFLCGWLEASGTSNVRIATFESNSLWIWFVENLSFVISNCCNFEAGNRRREVTARLKNKRIQLSVIKWRNAVESMSSRMSASLLSFNAMDRHKAITTVHPIFGGRQERLVRSCRKQKVSKLVRI